MNGGRRTALSGNVGHRPGFPESVGLGALSTNDDEAPHYHGHRDRLRARFSEVGGDALPDYELLEIVLFRSIPRRDVKPIAKESTASARAS